MQVSTIGYRIVHDINKVLMAMPSALVSAIVMSHPGRGMRVADLVFKYEALCDEITMVWGFPLLSHYPLTLLRDHISVFWTWGWGSSRLQRGGMLASVEKESHAVVARTVKYFSQVTWEFFSPSLV